LLNALFCSIKGTLGSAKDGAKQAEEESSLESDSGILFKKRKRKVSQRYDPDEDEEKRDNAENNLPKRKRQKHGADTNPSLPLLRRYAYNG